MANFVEAQYVFEISLKKIMAWQKKRHAGTDLHRNLLLACVLLKAHSACDDLDDLVVTLDDLSSCVDARTNDEVLQVDPVHSWNSIPDQTSEDVEFFGSDSEQLDENCMVSTATKRTNNGNVEEKSSDTRHSSELNGVSKVSNSLSKKRRLEIEESESDSKCKRTKTDSSQ